jgi:hypothetical protein
VQAMTPRRPADGDRVKPRGFDEDVSGLGRDHRIPAAHDAGQAERLGVVGDDQIVGVEGALYAVQSLELFAFAGAADDDAALDLVQIKCVSRLTHGQPGKVRGVDGVENLLLFEEREIAGDLGRQAPVNRAGSMVTLRKTRAVKRPQASCASNRTENGAAAGFAWGSEI